MPTLTIENLIAADQDLFTAYNSSYEETVANVYYATFVAETPGEGAKVHDFYGGLIVPRKQFEDDQFGFATYWAVQMGELVALVPGRLAIEAFKDNIVGYDGLPYFHPAHPVDPGDPANFETYSNARTASPLTVDNFVAARAQMRSYRTPGGPSRGLVPKFLIVPPALEKLATEVSKGTPSVEVIVASDLASGTPGGSDTTWYLSTTIPGKKMTHPVSVRGDAVVSSYLNHTQDQIDALDQLEWHLRVQISVEMGHPFLAIRNVAV